jgi:crotonobetainyl-CoA:carnitine CoA-transferase CaiB-like acyl-CoA transferase
MRAAPLAGADTEDVLRGLGYGPDDIAALREKGVI